MGHVYLHPQLTYAVPPDFEPLGRHPDGEDLYLVFSGRIPGPDWPVDRLWTVISERLTSPPLSAAFLDRLRLVTVEAVTLLALIRNPNRSLDYSLTVFRARRHWHYTISVSAPIRPGGWIIVRAPDKVPVIWPEIPQIDLCHRLLINHSDGLVFTPTLDGHLVISLGCTEYNSERSAP